MIVDARLPFDPLSRYQGCVRGVLEAFKECGWASWLALLAGMGGLSAGFIGLVMLATRARRHAWVVGIVAALLGCGAVAVGLLGRQMGLSRMEEVLGDPSIDIDPHQRQLIRRVGTEEANQCVKIGGSLGAAPLLLGVAAIGIGLALRKKPA